MVEYLVACLVEKMVDEWVVLTGYHLAAAKVERSENQMAEYLVVKKVEMTADKLADNLADPTVARSAALSVVQSVVH